MLNTIFAKKSGMKQWFDEAGRRHGVTMLSVPDIKISGFRNIDKHGYTALQVQVGRKTKREVRTNETDISGLKLGDVIDWTQIFAVGDRVKVSGVSKGKGFAGVVKRHGFAGGPRTHGQSDRERAPGSIGAGTTPGRVIKGKRMAGRMGNALVTIKNLKVVATYPDQKQIWVSGAVPGANTKLVSLTKI